jgi:aryl-alcohol dehydrogenase-like predicted oxidoreductase
MIPSVRLGATGIFTSRLAFGTSRLHYVGRRESQRLLAAAGEQGFVHFDTAPAYGDGLAEIELGRFVRSQRDRFVIATKYGIPADPFVEQWGPIVPPLRHAVALARRAGLRRSCPPTLIADGLEKSVEASLRRLKIDWIDILFLHEPRLERVPRLAEMLEQLFSLKARGLIRTFGVAGSWGGIGTVTAAAPELAHVVQTSEAEWPENSPPEICYGAILSGKQNYLSAGVSGDVALERLRSALKRRPNGVVIVSTTKVDRVRVLASVAAEPQP